MSGWFVDMAGLPGSTGTVGQGALLRSGMQSGTPRDAPARDARMTAGRSAEWFRPRIAFIVPPARGAMRRESPMIQRIARFGFVVVIGFMCLSPRGAEAALGASDV